MIVVSAVVIGCPSTAVSPCFRARRRKISENRVVLPAPLGPKRIATSPAFTANDTSHKTCRLPKANDTPETVSMVIDKVASVRVPAILECFRGSGGVFLGHFSHGVVMRR